MPTDLIVTPFPPEPLVFVPFERPQKPDKDFIELGYMPDPDGMIARLTERHADGRISACFFRKFEQGGRTAESAFFAHRHLDAIERLVPWLRRMMPLFEDQARTRIRLAGGPALRR